MSFLGKLKKIDPEAAIGIAGHALEVIGSLVHSSGASHAADTVTAIGHIYGIVTDTVDEKISPEQALSEIQAFGASIKANDNAADAALDDKFDK